MFGITNACNLRCEFCSRDVKRASEWTVESAASILEGLASAGTLEVAFGGGEPFAFRGFAELVARLRRTTSLAIHVTTNGTLLDSKIEFAQVRLSIYEGWRQAAQKLAGRRWGANLLVDDAMVDALPSLLHQVAALGATDVSLLSYVGPDPARHLTRDLTPVVRSAPLPCRVSVCFGDRLPRLFGGDCGAGLDFITLTSDRRLQSCSFQDVSTPVSDAEDVLRLWGRRSLDAPSPRVGCHRSSVPTQNDGIRIWQGFSGNNSGECILVARFDEVAGAERMLADVMPGFEPGRPYSAPWRELFASEGVVGPHAANGHMPDELLTVGRTFIARTDTALSDDFPELRALAWKRGAAVQAGGLQGSNTMTVLYALRARNAKDAERFVRRGARRHGNLVFGGLRVHHLEEVRMQLEAFRRPFAIEIFTGKLELTKALKRVGHLGPPRKRLFASFWNQPKAARAFAEEAGAPLIGNLVLVDRVVRPKRLALRALGHGGAVSAIEGEEVQVNAFFRLPPAPPRKGSRAPRPELDLEGLERAIRIPFPQAKVDHQHATVCTTTPVPVLTSLDAIGRSFGFDVSLGVSELRALDRAVARLIEDLEG